MVPSLGLEARFHPCYEPLWNPGNRLFSRCRTAGLRFYPRFRVWTMKPGCSSTGAAGAPVVVVESGQKERDEEEEEKGRGTRCCCNAAPGLEAGVNEPLWKPGSRLFSRSGKWVLLFTHGLESGPRNRVVVAWGTGYQSTGVERVVRTR